MIKAIFFDIDGTLYSHKNHQIPKSALNALMQLRTQGIILFISTGRHMIMIEHLLGSQFLFDGYVSLTGQICLNREKEIFYRNPICQEDTKKIIEFFNKKTVPLTLMEENRRYINFDSSEAGDVLKTLSSFSPPVEAYHGGALYQVSGFLREEDAEELLSPLTSCKYTMWNDGAIDIIPADGGKTTGIRRLLEYYHLSADSIMSFGDGDNDADMLEFAQIGVAMGNASPKAKEAADYTTTDIDDGGIANALKHFHLL